MHQTDSGIQPSNEHQFEMFRKFMMSEYGQNLANNFTNCGAQNNQAMQPFQQQEVTNQMPSQNFVENTACGFQNFNSGELGGQKANNAMTPASQMASNANAGIYFTNMNDGFSAAGLQNQETSHQTTRFGGNFSAAGGIVSETGQQTQNSLESYQQQSSATIAGAGAGQPVGPQPQSQATPATAQYALHSNGQRPPLHNFPNSSAPLFAVSQPQDQVQNQQCLSQQAVMNTNFASSNNANSSSENDMNSGGSPVNSSDAEDTAQAQSFQKFYGKAAGPPLGYPVTDQLPLGQNFHQSGASQLQQQYSNWQQQQSLPQQQQFPDAGRQQTGTTTNLTQSDNANLSFGMVQSQPQNQEHDSQTAAAPFSNHNGLDFERKQFLGYASNMTAVRADHPQQHTLAMQLCHESSQPATNDMCQNHASSQLGSTQTATSSMQSSGRGATAKVLADESQQTHRQLYRHPDCYEPSELDQTAHGGRNEGNVSARLQFAQIGQSSSARHRMADDQPPSKVTRAQQFSAATMTPGQSFKDQNKQKQMHGGQKQGSGRQNRLAMPNPHLAQATKQPKQLQQLKMTNVFKSQQLASGGSPDRDRWRQFEHLKGAEVEQSEANLDQQQENFQVSLNKIQEKIQSLQYMNSAPSPPDKAKQRSQVKSGSTKRKKVRVQQETGNERCQSPSDDRWTERSREQQKVMALQPALNNGQFSGVQHASMPATVRTYDQGNVDEACKIKDRQQVIFLDFFNQPDLAPEILPGKNLFKLFWDENQAMSQIHGSVQDAVEYLISMGLIEADDDSMIFSYYAKQEKAFVLLGRQSMLREKLAEVSQETVLGRLSNQMHLRVRKVKQVRHESQTPQQIRPNSQELKEASLPPFQARHPQLFYTERQSPYFAAAERRQDFVDHPNSVSQSKVPQKPIQKQTPSQQSGPSQYGHAQKINKNGHQFQKAQSAATHRSPQRTAPQQSPPPPRPHGGIPHEYDQSQLQNSQGWLTSRFPQTQMSQSQVSDREALRNQLETLCNLQDQEATELVMNERVQKDGGDASFGSASAAAQAYQNRPKSRKPGPQNSEGVNYFDLVVSNAAEQTQSTGKPAAEKSLRGRKPGVGRKSTQTSSKGAQLKFKNSNSKVEQNASGSKSLTAREQASQVFRSKSPQKVTMMPSDQQVVNDSVFAHLQLQPTYINQFSELPEAAAQEPVLKAMTLQPEFLKKEDNVIELEIANDVAKPAESVKPALPAPSGKPKKSIQDAKETAPAKSQAQPPAPAFDSSTIVSKTKIIPPQSPKKFEYKPKATTATAEPVKEPDPPAAPFKEQPAADVAASVPSATAKTQEEVKEKSKQMFLQVMQEIRELKALKGSKVAPPDIQTSQYRYMQRKTITGCLSDFYQSGGTLSDHSHKITMLYRLGAFYGYNFVKNKNNFLHHLLDFIKSQKAKRAKRLDLSESPQKAKIGSLGRKAEEGKDLSQQANADAVVVPAKRTFEDAKLYENEKAMTTASFMDLDDGMAAKRPRAAAEPEYVKSTLPATLSDLDHIPATSSTKSGLESFPELPTLSAKPDIVPQFPELPQDDNLTGIPQVGQNYEPRSDFYNRLQAKISQTPTE